MRLHKIPLAVAITAAAVGVSACGQAGPLYLPETPGSHKNKPLERKERAAAQGNKPLPSPTPENGTDSPPATGINSASPSTSTTDQSPTVKGPAPVAPSLPAANPSPK